MHGSKNTPFNVGSVLRRLLSTAGYWTAYEVLMLSPTVLNSLRSSDAIPPQYWCYPPAVLNRRYTGWRSGAYGNCLKVIMILRAQYCFRAVHDYSQHLKKNVRALDCVSSSKIFLRAGNNPFVLKNSTEHAEPLFIASSECLIWTIYRRMILISFDKFVHFESCFDKKSNPPNLHLCNVCTGTLHENRNFTLTQF